MFTSASRSWELIKASLAVISADGELLLLPVLSGLATVILAGVFVYLGTIDGTFAAMHEDGAWAAPNFYAWLFFFYVAQYFVIYFFNTALVGAALQRLDGEDPTIRSALAVALSRIGPILGYAVISATVGMILRVIAERTGFIGRIIETFVGLAWTVATFLVVPLLAAEGVGPVEAVQRSSALLRKTWGENLIGTAGMSLVFSLATAVAAIVFFGGGALLLQAGYETSAVIAFIIGGAIVLAMVLLAATLSAVYQAAVYDYAVTGRPPLGFDRGLVDSAFRPKS